MWMGCIPVLVVNRLETGVALPSSWRDLGRSEFPDALRDFINLIPAHLREHRQGHDLRGDALRYREVSLFVIQVRVRFLQMQRNWIVNARADAGFRKRCLQRFALLHAYY